MIKIKRHNKALKILARRQTLLERFPVKAFPHQRSVMESVAKRKLVVCSRRAGKTTLSLAHIYKTMINKPGCKCAYLALTYKSAKRIAWTELKKYLHGIVPVDAFSESDLSVTFPNGSTLFLAGADNVRSVEGLRGISLDLAVVDECASYAKLEYLVQDIIQPTLIDTGGELLLIGTPGPPYGYFYEAHKAESGYEVTTWLTDQNPHISAEALAEMKTRYSPNDPAYRREMLAEFASAEDAVFSYTDANVIDSIELDSDWKYIVGIDHGVRDDSAITIVANSRFHEHYYVMDAWSKPGMQIKDIADQLKVMTKQYPANQLWYVYDSAALTMAQELTARFGFPMIPAKKQDKNGNIARCNNLLYQGLLKVTRNANQLLNEFDVLVWKEGIKEEWKDNLPDHVTDAWLYAMKYAYTHKDGEPDVKYVPEWEKTRDPREQAKIRQQMEKKEMESLWGDADRDYM